MSRAGRAAAAPSLVRVLTAAARSAGCAGEVCAITEIPWASATFVGTRHLLRYTATPSPARTAWLAALPEAPFYMPGHLLADLIVESASGDEVVLAALTLDAT